MSALDKGSKNIRVVETKARERGPLSSNKANVRSLALGFNPNNEFVSEEIALDYLASILVEIFLHTHHANSQPAGTPAQRAVK